MSATEHATRRKIDGWTTREGQVIAWADIDDRHLLNIVRMLTRAVRKYTANIARPDEEIVEHYARRLEANGEGYYAADLRRRNPLGKARTATTFRLLLAAERTKTRKTLCIALDEVEYRGLLPTLDDLRVAWDRACEAGAADDPKQRPWCLIELWVGFRGESTLSPEWQLANAGLTGATASTTPAPHA